MVIFLSACVEGILQFTNFYLQRKFLIFLRNDCDCKVVDQYKARKRYTVTESLSHCFCKRKKPNKNFLKLKCDWWCSYFYTTEGYLRFVPTNGQMTVPFFPVVIWSTKVGTHQKTQLIIFIFKIWDMVTLENTGLFWRQHKTQNTTHTEVFFYSYVDPIHSWHLTGQLNKEDLDLHTWAFRWCLCPVEYGRV